MPGGPVIAQAPSARTCSPPRSAISAAKATDAGELDASIFHAGARPGRASRRRVARPPATPAPGR
jgi:hypothetical protein